jgi:hypothetical protein
MIGAGSGGWKGVAVVLCAVLGSLFHGIRGFSPLFIEEQKLQAKRPAGRAVPLKTISIAFR